MKATVFVSLLFAAFQAYAGGLGPWSFGMSAEQIRAVSDFGPYKDFTNGDLETYNGDFGGKKENVQFFLKAGILWRIGVYTYEGTDLTAATEAWARTYATLQSTYGSIATPKYQGATPTELAAAARAIVAAGGNAQMAPVQQPAEEFVFSSFQTYNASDKRFYIVTVYYDRLAPEHALKPQPLPGSQDRLP